MELANVKVECTFLYDSTASYFGNWVKENKSEKTGLTISDLFWNSWTRHVDKIDGKNEYSAFAMASSDVLLNYNRCLFHAAAVRFRNRAWLIAAPSGVGKSTQVLTLQKLYPDELAVISGDKPILELTENSQFMVHPSPWNGKEGWSGAEKAQLAGIVCLQRGDQNQIEKLSVNRSAAHIFTSILQTGEKELTIKKAAEFAEKMISTIPVWMLTNKGIPVSTEILYKMMAEETKYEL